MINIAGTILSIPRFFFHKIFIHYLRIVCVIFSKLGRFELDIFNYPLYYFDFHAEVYLGSKDGKREGKIVYLENHAKYPLAGVYFTT